MPRAPHPAAKAASAAKYLPQLADPLDPIAEQVGKEVAAEVKCITALHLSTGDKKPYAVAAGDLEGAELEAHITVLVAKALDRSLSAPTAEGKALRMALIAKLANVEVGGIAVAGALKPAADALLTTAEAAVKLEVSRPHVSMLCDQGKLGEVVMTAGGHRRIRAAAVDAYMATRTKQHQGAKSPRQAGVDAGLYDVPDGHFKNVVRRTPSVGKPPRMVSNAPRKRHS